MQQYKAMMSEAETELIKGLLNPSMSCLEYGSGYSTAYFSKFVKFWHSIESDKNWYKKVEEMIELEGVEEKVKLELKKDELDDYLKADLSSYDFILIDGKYRKECLDLSVKQAKKEAIIILHDAMRYEYKDWVNKYPYKKLIDGEIIDDNFINYYKHRGIYQYGNNN